MDTLRSGSAAGAGSAGPANTVRATAAVSAVRASAARTAASGAGGSVCTDRRLVVSGGHVQERPQPPQFRARVGGEGSVVDHRPALGRQPLQLTDRDPRGRLPLGGHRLLQGLVAKRAPAGRQDVRPGRPVPAGQIGVGDRAAGLPLGQRGGHRGGRVAVQEHERGVREHDVQERHAQGVVGAVHHGPQRAGERRPQPLRQLAVAVARGQPVAVPSPPRGVQLGLGLQQFVRGARQRAKVWRQRQGVTQLTAARAGGGDHEHGRRHGRGFNPRAAATCPAAWAGLRSGRITSSAPSGVSYGASTPVRPDSSPARARA